MRLARTGLQNEKFLHHNGSSPQMIEQKITHNDKKLQQDTLLKKVNGSTRDSR